MMIIKALLVSLLGLCSLWVNAADTMTMNVDKSCSTFMVTLPANPTTGFQWTVTEYDKSLLNLKASQFIGQKTSRIGAGGQMRFTFELVKGQTYPQSTEIVFRYSRAWEPGSASSQKVIVNFTVSSPQLKR